MLGNIQGRQLRRDFPHSDGELVLDVRSEWAEMGRVNLTASEFLESRRLSTENIYRYTMIVCELVENGIKYGFFENKVGTVHVVVGLADNQITVQVTNPVGKRSEPHLRELDRTIQWVRGFQDPFEAYLERMKAISREPIEVNKSGLGIVRITYEGRAALDFYLDEDNTLSVSAVSSVN